MYVWVWGLKRRAYIQQHAVSRSSWSVSKVTCRAQAWFLDYSAWHDDLPQIGTPTESADADELFRIVDAILDFYFGLVSSTIAHP
jgi:hypothetical protein